MARRGRLAAKSFFLTFSQSSLEKSFLFNFLKSLEHVSYVLLSQEAHQDGGVHYHCLLYFSKQLDILPTHFDCSSEHPNVRTVGQRVDDWKRVDQYVRKDDSDPLEWGQPRHRGNRWAPLLSASSYEAAMELVRSEFTREYFCSYHSVTAAVAAMFPVRPAIAYEPRFSNFPRLPSVLSEWVSGELSLPRRVRPRSLVLIGGSRLGKTEWARSLGSHVYLGYEWSATDFIGLPDSFWWTGYVVVDDWSLDEWRRPKAWLGGQRDFIVTDKYRKKMKLAGGIPTIVLCNPEDYDGTKFAQLCNSDWGRSNVTVVRLLGRLYD